MTTEPEVIENRRCTTCHDLNQSRPACIYSKNLGKCPQCGNPEFSVTTKPITPLSEATMTTAKSATKPAAKSAQLKAKAKAVPGTAPPPKPAPPAEPQYRRIPLEMILPDPANAREDIDPEADDIKALAETIEQVGLAQPLVVRPMPDSDYFTLIAGHRRLVACQVAGQFYPPCIVRDCTPEEWTLLQIVENGQRKDLSVIEEARSYAGALETLGISQSALAEKIGKSQGYISQRVNLLRLPEFLQDAIEDGLLTIAQGRILSSLADLPIVITEFCDAFRNHEWSGDDGESIDWSDFEDCLMAGLDTGMRLVAINGMPRITFELADYQRKNLDIREITLDGDVEQWAANF